MARKREVGTLWIGGRLSWLEQLCLKSFVDQGQSITLFAYEDIPNVPPGVIRRDGREVLDTADFIKYEAKDSFALFADYFRLHMIRQNPGMIWVDADVYCHRPMEYDSDYVMGFELPGQPRVNNAVLGLPAESAVLADMLQFMADRFAIPPFLKPSLQAEYRAAAAAGQPVHVSRQPWGVWGPLMLTHFAYKHRILDKVLPPESFYPIAFPDRLRFLRRTKTVNRHLTEATTALHLWASNKLTLGRRHDGMPPENSYLADLLRKHDIDPQKAPIIGRSREIYDAGMVARVPLEKVARFADIGGNAQAQALAAWKKWGCAIDLIDMTPTGDWPKQPSAWVTPYRLYLTEHGVPFDHITHIATARSLTPAQLVVQFSDLARGDWGEALNEVLNRALAPGGYLLCNIRKGSGGFPFLRPRGTITKLSNRSDAGGEVHRVMLAASESPAPILKPKPEGDWAEIAKSLAGKDGFYREGGEHAMLFVKRSDTLVVTFDNLDLAMEKREDKRPWGFAFIEKQGWSMLGVTAVGWTWFRDPWVYAQFDLLKTQGFFKNFKRVVFYGASMGGYGACAFVAACPGADVVAISPQSTLDKTLVPFETRYKTAWQRDFSGPYGDAARVSAKAGRVTLIYDPYEPLDNGHACRFTGPNVTKLRAPLLGHRLGSSLHQMGILSPIVLGALNGSLTETAFYQQLRARKHFARYQKELFKRALAKGHPKLAARMGRWVLAQGSNRYIRKALEQL